MKPTVLIIEDEHHIASAEKLILEDYFAVHIAKDGHEGLEKAKKIKPDLVILDLMLPKRGGYDLCFTMRQHPDLKNSKILMVTARAQQIDKDKGTMVGADDYLTKPFDADELLRRAQSLLK